MPRPVHINLETAQDLFRRVERAKQEWETTADAIPDLICLVDSGGRIVRANRTVEEWGGARVTEVPGRHLHSLLHPKCDDPSCYLVSLLSRLPDVVFRGDRLCEKAYDPHLDKYLQATVHPLPPQARDKNVNRSAAVVVLRDVSEREKFLEELQRANKALHMALKAKEEMILYVSHELRTPLTVIEGYLSLLRDGILGALNSEQQEAVRTMTSEAQRLLGQINRLLALQRVEAESPYVTVVDLGSLVHWVVPGWKTAARRSGVEIEVRVEDSPLNVRVDMDRVQQMLSELLDNAIKFSPNGGKVVVRVWKQEDMARLSVSDEGIGIPPEALPHVFQHFLQVNGGLSRRIGGMGIGLALCRKIVEAHGGRIWAESPGEGKGSTFHVALPLAK